LAAAAAAIVGRAVSYPAQLLSSTGFSLVITLHRIQGETRSQFIPRHWVSSVSD